MTRAPWEADHEFDAAAAEGSIRASFPGFDFSDVRYFAEGWDFRMFEVDGEWLFRFAKRDECRVRLIQERTVLDALDGALSVPIPRIEFRANEVVGYRKLSGTPLTEARCIDDFAASLGQFATRARFYGRCMAIGHIQYGIEAANSIHLQRGVDGLGRVGC